MMRLILFALLLIATPALCVAQDHTPRTTPTPAPRTAPTPTPPPTQTITRLVGDSWVNYNSTEGKYRVLLPVQPTLTSQPSESSDGVKFTQYLANATTNTAVYMIGYFDLPNTTFNFDRARDGMINAVNGTLLSETAISLGGHPGRELKISGKSDGGVAFQVRARIYHIQTRVFVLQYLYQPDVGDESMTRNQNKYFDSFAVDSSQ